MKANINWFLVFIIYTFVQIIHSSTLNYRKSNDARKNLFPLSLIHINDFHARYYGDFVYTLIVHEILYFIKEKMFNFYLFSFLYN